MPCWLKLSPMHEQFSDAQKRARTLPQRRAKSRQGTTTSAGGFGNRREPLGSKGATSDLASVVAQRLVHDFDTARNLVADQALAQESEQLVYLELPGSASTIAWTMFPRSSSGSPITAQDSTAGCSAMADSTSAG